MVKLISQLVWRLNHGLEDHGIKVQFSAGTGYFFLLYIHILLLPSYPTYIPFVYKNYVYLNSL
jgi:hypothetical protein